MKRRVLFLAAILVLGLPLITAEQVMGQSPSEPFSEREDVVTMPKMRYLVPRLMELGWNDFFLNARLLNSLAQNAPSPDQVRDLISLQGRFVEEWERSRGRLMEASLVFYQELNEDQISARQIQSRINALIALEGQLVGLRVQYLLRAINVFNHEQHERLAALPSPAFSPLVRPRSPVPPRLSQIPRPFANEHFAQ